MAARPHVPPILRSKFIAGLVILVPIVVTVKALVWLFNYLDDLAQPFTGPEFRVLPFELGDAPLHRPATSPTAAQEADADD